MIAKGHVRFVSSVSFSATGSADNSQPENLFLAFEQFIAQKLSLCLFKADALDGVGKTLAGNALITEKKNGFFNNAHQLFFVGENLAENPSVCNTLAPTSADIDLPAVGTFVITMERALADTTAAAVAKRRVNHKLTVQKFCGMNRAGKRNLTFFTALA